MKAVVTGAGGFVGGYLCKFLRKKRVRVFGLGRKDLASKKVFLSRIQKIKPDVIFHLAAQSNVPSALKTPSETLSNNLFAELVVLEAVKESGLKIKVIITGSSEAYGQVDKKDLPIHEDVPYKPLNIYGVSKAAQDLLARQYFQSYGVPVVRICAFNHIGPCQEPRFAASSFAQQVAQIEKGLKKPVLQVGSLAAVKDFTDVRDMVRAYWLAARKGIPGEKYNIGSGKGHKIREILDTYLKLAHVKIRVQKDKARFRPLEVPVHIADASKFRRLTGWSPEIPFKRTLRDILEDWRQRIHG